jgi:hypothetical protein
MRISLTGSLNQPGRLTRLFARVADIVPGPW